MAYLLQATGMKYMAIQRYTRLHRCHMFESMSNEYSSVHYHVKKALAKSKQLEFYWQQAWGLYESMLYILLLTYIIHSLIH
jgi:hypothetical protein